MNTSMIIIIALAIIFLIGLIAGSSSLKLKKDLIKIQANLNSKVGTLMYVLPSLLNIYKDKITNFSEVNKTLMINTKNFFSQKTNLKSLHSYINQSQQDINFLSQMLNKNFDQTQSFNTLQESIGFLEKVAPSYHLMRKIAIICTFGLFIIFEKRGKGNKVKIIS